MDETTKKSMVAKLMHGLQIRERFKTMLAAALAAGPATPAEIELARCRDYLDAWSLHQQMYRPRLGAPGSSSFAPDQTSASTASEYYERSDAWAMQQVDAAVEEDLPSLPEGRALWLALRMRWLNIRVGPRVFRSNRLTHLDPGEVDELADAAERALIPILKRRKVPL